MTVPSPVSEDSPRKWAGPAALCLASPGHVILAVTLIAVGILGWIQRDFGAIWQPVPRAVPARHLLAYLCAVISLTSGVGLLWRRTAALAARVLFAYLLLWMLLLKGHYILLAPAVEGSYQSCGETAVLVAGAWVLYVWLATDWETKHVAFVAGQTGLRLAKALYGLAMIAFGLSHFDYLQNTVSLVPAWLPWHTFWAYFTGAAYLAAGAAVLTGVCARLAAALSATQMGLFTLLVWVPVVAHDPTFVLRSDEPLVSWAVTAGAWVVADAYVKAPSSMAPQPS